jgi:hypothetical protein
MGFDQRISGLTQSKRLRTDRQEDRKDGDFELKTQETSPSKKITEDLRKMGQAHTR